MITELMACRSVLAERERELAALRAEVERLQMQLDARGNIIRYCAFVLTGDEGGDPQLGADRVTAKVERLRGVVDKAKEYHLARLAWEQAPALTRERAWLRMKNAENALHEEMRAALAAGAGE